MLDTTTDFGKRVEQRLEREQVIWFTTVREDGMPQPTPVWFYWDGQAVLIFSHSSGQKRRNLQQNSRVALNLNSTAAGSDVVILFGEARILPAGAEAGLVEAYLRKNAAGVERIGLTRAAFLAEYNLPILVQILRVRGH